MAVVSGVDYVLSPKTTWAFGESGLITGVLVGLTQTLFFFPMTDLSGNPLLVKGKPAQPMVLAALEAPAMTADALDGCLRVLAQGEGNALILELAPLKALRVKNGWFSRGIYWKKPEHTGWRGLSLAGKVVGAAFEAFYKSQLRE